MKIVRAEFIGGIERDKPVDPYVTEKVNQPNITELLTGRNIRRLQFQVVISIIYGRE